MRLRRWVGTGMMALLLWGAAGARAMETAPVYTTAAECRMKHKVSCYEVENGWSPSEWTDTSDAQGSKLVYDEENLRRQGMSMPIDTTGTLDHPVVAVDMNQVHFPDVQPYLDREVGRVRVPVRFVSEQMGAAVTWDGETQTVTITRDNLKVQLQVDNKTVLVNDKPVEIDAPPKLLPPGRVMVPLRFISEAFGAKVDWVGTEPPEPSQTAWGKYQVWIWVEWGYWGKYDMNDRFYTYSWWFKTAPKR